MQRRTDKMHVLLSDHHIDFLDTPKLYILYSISIRFPYPRLEYDFATDLHWLDGGLAP